MKLWKTSVVSTRRVQLRILQMHLQNPPAPEQITADEGTFHGRYHLFACLCPSLSHLWVGMFPERTPLLGCKSLSRFSAHMHKETATYPHVTMLLEWLTSPQKKLENMSPKQVVLNLQVFLAGKIPNLSLANTPYCFHHNEFPTWRAKW